MNMLIRRRRNFRECEYAPGQPCEGEDNLVDCEVVCKRCGLVMKKIYTDEQEWRNFSDSTNDKSRITFLLDCKTINSLTENENKNEDKKQNEFNKYLEQYSKELGLENKIIEEGKRIYQSIPSNKLKNQQVKLVVIGVLYKISKSNGITLKDLTNKLDIDKKDIRKGIKIINELVKDKNERNNICDILLKKCNELKIIESMYDECKEIEPLVSSFLEGKNPKTITAVIIILVSKYKNENNLKFENEVINCLGISNGNIKSILNSLTQQEKYKINEKIKGYINYNRN